MQGSHKKPSRHITVAGISSVASVPSAVYIRVSAPADGFLHGVSAVACVPDLTSLLWLASLPGLTPSVSGVRAAVCVNEFLFALLLLLQSLWDLCMMPLASVLLKVSLILLASLLMEHPRYC